MNVSRDIAYLAQFTRHPVCLTFAKLRGFPGCCESCHVEHEQRGYGLVPVTIATERGNVEAVVCCEVKDWINRAMADGSNGA